MLRNFLATGTRASRAFSRTATFSNEQPSKKEVDELFAEKSERDNSPMRRRHAYSVNKVELIGGVALDPVLRTAKNEKPYLLFNIITNNYFKQRDGNYVDQTERHAITVFGKQAEVLSKTIKKGSRLMVQGRLHYSGGVKDEQGNRSQRNTYIIAHTVQPLAKREQQQEN